MNLSLNHQFFVNNAHSNFGQVELLSKVFETWRAQGKSGSILNIGSRAGSEFPARQVPIPYDYEKLALFQLSKSLSSLESSIRVMCVNFGYIATERILARTELKSVPKLDLNHAAKLAAWLLNLPIDCTVPEITVLPVRS